MFCVYTIFNKINGKIYVGETVDYETRWRAHIKLAHSHCYKRYSIHRAIFKYGIDAFEFSILQKFLTKKDMKDAEVYWIKYFNSKNNKFGYNLTDGGDGWQGLKRSKVVTQINYNILRQSLIDNDSLSLQEREDQIKLVKIKKPRVHSQQTKNKMSKSQTGRKHSTETKNKMSLNQIGKKGRISKQGIENIKKANKERTVSDETKLKISKSLTGLVKNITDSSRQKMRSSRLGKPLLTETKLKISGENNVTSKLKEYQVIEIRTKFSSKKYSYKELALEHNIHVGTISDIVLRKTWKHI